MMTPHQNWNDVQKKRYRIRFTYLIIGFASFYKASAVARWHRGLVSRKILSRLNMTELDISLTQLG